MLDIRMKEAKQIARIMGLARLTENLKTNSTKQNFKETYHAKPQQPISVKHAMNKMRIKETH